MYWGLCIILSTLVMAVITIAIFTAVGEKFIDNLDHQLPTNEKLVIFFDLLLILIKYSFIWAMCWVFFKTSEKKLVDFLIEDRIDWTLESGAHKWVLIILICLSVAIFI